MAALCRVCQRARSRYTCPRCEAATCSLECYRQHSTRCTEEFYKSQVEGELRSQAATGAERRRLERALLQLRHLGDENSAEDSEDCEEDSRLDRLAELAQQGQLSAEDLTEEELQHFHAELKSGSLGRALGAWEPWWQNAAVLLESDTPAPHLCCTSQRRASPLVALTVLEALYAYAHTLRAFNGDWAWDPLRAATHFLHLAKAVSSQKVYQTPAECFANVRGAAAAEGNFGADLAVLCIADVAMIIERRGGSVLRALREAGEILSKAKEGAVGGLHRSAKKLEFLVSFAQHHEEEVEVLAAEAQAAAALQRETLQQAQEPCEPSGIALPRRE